MISGDDDKKKREGDETNDGMVSDAISDASRVVPIYLEKNFRTIDYRSLEGSAYRAEGNATLVVSLPSERKVLRFRKSDPDAGDEPAEDEGETRVRLIQDFYRNVISGLLGIYTRQPEIVRCSREDLRRLMRIFESRRPENRRHKKVLETFATALPDYTLLPQNLHEKIVSLKNSPTFCIEIKPKEGLFNKNSLPPGKCDYCQKQHLKMAQGKISLPSKYCPLVFFSGEIDRMRRAFRGLIDSPQNNFRIFKNGNLVWGEEFEPEELEKILTEWFFHDKSFDRERALDLLFKLIHEALLRPFPQSEKFSDSTTLGPLPANSILERILRFQRRYRCSLSSVYPIYSAYSKILTDEMIYSQNISGDNKKNFKDQNEGELNLMPNSEDLQTLRNYLIYRILRDCSILVAFREIDSMTISNVPRENVIQISDMSYFLFNNAVTDLDPKSVHSIKKHHRRTAENLKVTRQGQSSAALTEQRKEA